MNKKGGVVFKKKYQIFISSTYLDLKEERQKIIEAVLAAGHIPAGMELFHAGNETQKELIEEWIEGSDIYVLLLGGRYGSMDKDGKSYTEWEYETAGKLKKPRFSLVLSDGYINDKVQTGKIMGTEIETRLPQFIQFKENVMSQIVSQIENINQIESEIIKSLNRIEKKENKNLEGWIKGRYLFELEELRNENKSLSEKLVLRQEEFIDMQKDLKAVKDDYIGDVSFPFITEKLRENKISFDIFDEEIAKLENAISDSDSLNRGYAESQKKELQKLKNMKAKNCNLLELLLLYKQDILEDNFILNFNSIGTVIKRGFIPLLDQFQLVSVENISGGQYSRAYRKLRFNENGKKFITMLEIQLEE